MINNYPSIDLHGEYLDNAIILVNDFINDNILLQNENIVIIHGVGKDILRKGIHDFLKHNKNVLSYKRDYFNIGMTIVKLKINK